MNEGWIKLHRQLISWEWYDDIPTKVAFLHLILVCNHTKTKWRGIELDAGETIKSLSTLSKESGLSMMQWRTSIEKLKSTQSLTERKHGKHRILKLNKYGQFQQGNTIDNTMVTRSQHDGNTMITTDKNEKNDKNERMKRKHTDADASGVHVISEEESEFRKFIPFASKALHHEKTFTADGLKKWKARRLKFSARQLAEAFANLSREPDLWKIKHNGFRSLKWWLHSDERIEEMMNCHLKASGKGTTVHEI